MSLKTKLALLDRMYRLYDAVITTYDLACRKFCSDCCTRNVTLTTLEGYKIIDHLILTSQTDVLKNLNMDASRPRFQPRTTTNRIAQLCMQGLALPEEDIDPGWGACPLLKKNMCVLYSVRPFGCRCMVSIKKCDASGCADVDDFLMSVNTVFMQTIEHVDAGGQSGNLSDVLRLMESNDIRRDYEKEVLHRCEGLVRNRPIPVLLIPPEHRTRIKPILRDLQSI